MKKLAFFACAAALTCAFTVRLFAADHGDGLQASADEMADLNDGFLFLDPNDNSRVIMEMTVRGFIIPSEAVNMGFFDPNVIYRFALEGTGDATPDATINVTFAPKANAA